jgi:hypothetical protein
MKLSDLLGNGFFCEELPPPFSTKLLGTKSATILKAMGSLPKMTDFNCANFIAPKVGIHRRHFSIPHPYPQIKLSDAIVKNWKAILTEYDKSNISLSKPEIDKEGKRAVVYLDKFESFRESCIIASSTKRYQLQLDIAKYFFSIYTHSIPWAIHSKLVAKANRGSSLWGNQIDTLIRLSQSNQTKGIPVGTDTSRIIAELVGCEIDAQFENALHKHGIKVNGYRFVDDCRYYFDTLSDAELALREYQKILTEYSLNLNDEKTHIQTAPCLFDSSWKLPLNSAPLEAKLDKNQRSDLKNYFNLLIKLAHENPKDSVVKYGLRRISKLDVHQKNIDIFESLLYCVALHETGVLPIVLNLLTKYKSHLSKNGVTNFVKSLIDQNIHKGHHYEVSWALWIAKCFGITIPSDVAQQIIDSRDVISIIILLDLYQTGKISGTINTIDLESDLNLSSLDGELWLLAYEAEIKKWLPLNNIALNPFFQILEKNKISFYTQPNSIKATATKTKAAYKGVSYLTGSTNGLLLKLTGVNSLSHSSNY